MIDFEGVVPALGQALNKRGYTELTKVQMAVIAPELKDADALVSAQTGSGKTVAFGLALAPTLLNGEERFGRAERPVALAVAPTRELALQVMRELEWLYAETGAKVVSCVGGMDMRTERRNLQNGAHIVVGTPGRLRDHIERGSFDTSGLKGVVLDEADEMLDLGFRDDLEYILDAAPADRRTLLFSATVSRPIATLAKKFQRDAVRVTTTSEREQHLDIEYRALTIAPNDRENAIINVLRYYEAKSAIVFCATRATVNHMTSRFNNRGFSVVALSGELSQNERTHALQAMRDGRARVCVATDVAARGIDLPNLELVIHADIPKSREPLLHRSGRTGRAGRKGTSVLIVPHNWRKRTERLFESANIQAEWAKPPSLEEIATRDHQRILDAPAFDEPLTDDEIAFAQELLAKHGAEQIAAAYLRLHRTDQPSPEEMIDAGPSMEREKPQRDDFKNGVWFSLSVGRKHNAEPRWLLPMLCRAGHITKRDIGAIKIHQTETHIELAPESVDKFLEAIGPTRKVEKTITVDRLKGVPDGPKEGPKGGFKDGPPANPYAKKRPFKGKPGDSKKPYGDKPGQDRDRPPAKRKTLTMDVKPGAKQDDKPWEKAAKNPKKTFKSKFAKGDGKAEGKSGSKSGSKPGTNGFGANKSPRKPGSTPLKRKKTYKKAD